MKTDMVIHTGKIEMMKPVVEIECVGMKADEFDKETGSSDGLQPEQADLNCAHTLYEPHLHEIHVVPSKHEAGQHSLCGNPIPRKSRSGSGSLPSNTIANTRGDVKAITTRSGVAYKRPSIPPTSYSLQKEVECEPEATKDKKLSLPDLTPTRMTLELATRSIDYPAGIAEDVFVQVGKFTFLADFVIVDYDVDPRKKQEDKRIEEEQAACARYWKISACCDDDDDYNSAITPVLSTEETENSLSIGDAHLDTIPATESDKVIKSSVEDLVSIPSESEGIPDTMCDVHLVNNPTPLEAKDHSEITLNSNNDISSSDDDSLYKENIEYVEASPHDSEVVSLEAAEIVIPEVKEIEDDNLRKKLLNVHLLIAKIEALKDNPTPSSKLLTKSSSTSPKSFLEETNTFHNSLHELENFYFDLEEINSGCTTTHSDISLPDYEAFYFDEDHIKEISSGSTTTHFDISLSEYYSFIFDLPNDQFPPTDKSDFTHEEFADELAHIISPPEYDCFYFWNFPDPGESISILNSRICENPSTTLVNLPIEDDHSPLLAYVVWIFLAYLTYPVIPPYLHPFENEDTIFDPGITINRFYSFKPGVSHRCGTFKKFNTHRSHLNESLMEMFFSTYFPLD
nr:reverse transcriptase domain-containing protein [Tanacetum cinerariifolium]